MPQLGLGVYKVEAEEADDIVSTALEVGYRLIDTASMYGNEAGVGRAVARSEIAREEIFVTTKFWMDDLGYDNTIAACERSLELMGLDYLDMYMIHWPAPARGLYVESWRAMEALRERGLVRSIGVANFHPEHLNKIFDAGLSTPTVNQIEVHPWLTQDAVIAFNSEHTILTQAWSPLARGQILDEPVLAAIAGEHGRSIAQIVIRWHIQRGYSVIPKSVRRERMVENISVFDFTLSLEQMQAISALNRDYRTGVDPNDRN